MSNNEIKKKLIFFLKATLKKHSTQHELTWSTSHLRHKIRRKNRFFKKGPSKKIKAKKNIKKNKLTWVNLTNPNSGWHHKKNKITKLNGQ
jgi:hypothetical protein